MNSSFLSENKVNDICKAFGFEEKKRRVFRLCYNKQLDLDTAPALRITQFVHVNGLKSFKSSNQIKKKLLCECSGLILKNYVKKKKLLRQKPVYSSERFRV